MRRFILVAGALACLSLTACQGQVSEAEATPPPKKSLARPAQMYAGQDQINSVESGTVTTGPDGSLVLKVKGTTASAGWTDPAFLPRIYAATPPDGIYEVDVIASQPAAPGAQVVTPVEVSGDWGRYKDGRVKGVKFMSKTNDITVMVGGAAAGTNSGGG